MHRRMLLQLQGSAADQSVDIRFQIRASNITDTRLVANQLYNATVQGTLKVSLAMYIPS